MRFDWYQATVPQDVDLILDAAMSELPGAHDVERLDRGGKGYTAMCLIRDQERDVIGTVLHGSSSAAPNVKGTGINAEPVADLIRKHWPLHSVSRLDVAEDMTAPGLFGELSEKMRKVGKAFDMDSGLEFVPDVAEKGRTYRLGSPSSDVLVRCYEKGLELQGKGVEDADPHHVRLEIQVRPQKAAKKRFASIAPAEVWGSSRWTKQLASTVLSLDVERVLVNPRVRSGLEATTAHVVAQYLQHAIKHGTVIGERRHGLVDMTEEEAVDYWLHKVRELMGSKIRSDRIRDGIKLH